MLMVSTVRGHRQFSIEVYADGEHFSQKLHTLHEKRKDLLFFPLITLENVENVEDLLTNEQINELVDYIKEENPGNQQLSCRIKDSIWRQIRYIEHVAEDAYRIVTEEDSFITNRYEFYLHV